MKFDKIEMRKVRIGIEVEGIAKEDSIVLRLGEKIAEYHRGRYNKWNFKLEKDSSISGKEELSDTCLEVITKPFFLFRRGERGTMGLERITDLIRRDIEVGSFYYNETCGFHINISNVYNPVLFYILQKTYINIYKEMPRINSYTSWWCSKEKYNAFHIRRSRAFIVEWRTPTPKFLSIYITVLQNVIKRGEKSFYINLKKLNKNVRKLKVLFNGSAITSNLHCLRRNEEFETIYNVLFAILLARQSFAAATEGRGYKIGTARYRVQLPAEEEALESVRKFCDEAEELEFRSYHGGLNREEFRIREAMKMFAI